MEGPERTHHDPVVRNRRGPFVMLSHECAVLLLLWVPRDVLFWRLHCHDMRFFGFKVSVFRVSGLLGVSNAKAVHPTSCFPGYWSK